MLPIEIKKEIARQYDLMASEFKHISLFVPQSVHFYNTSKITSIVDAHKRTADIISVLVTKSSLYTKYTSLARKFIERPGQKVDTYVSNPSLNGIKNGGFYTSIADSIAIRNKYDLITLPGEESIIKGKDKNSFELLKYKLKELRVPITKIEKIVLDDDIYFMNEIVMYVEYEDYEREVLDPFRKLYSKYLELYMKKYADKLDLAKVIALESAKNDIWKKLEKQGYVKHEYTDGKVDDWKRYHKCFRKGYAHDFEESIGDYSKWSLKEQVMYDNRPLDSKGKIMKLEGRIK